MISSPKRSVSPFFFVAFVIAGFFIWATIQNNREISERRLAEPVQTIGVLLDSKCTSYQRSARTGFRQPYIKLMYKYLTVGTNPTPHTFITKQSFDTDKACEEYKSSISKVVTIWYEKAHAEKASLYETESDSWGFLYGLILAALFVLGGVYDQKSINKEKRESHMKRRDLNRLKRKGKA